MVVELGYGNGTQPLTVPDENLLALVLPKTVERPEISEEEIVRRAIAQPIGAPRLGEIVRPGETIAIVTSDITRPLPSHRILPALLDELYAAGARPEDLTLVFALGSHRRHTPEEMRRLAGERAWSEIRVLDADAGDCLRLGQTRRGTPVDLCRVVAQADRRICLGNIEYHYFAGYSGGAKALVPGVASQETIRQNHRLMAEPGAAAGVLEGNPVREDLEEAAALCPADFIVNVVLDEHKHILHAVAGHAIEAHRAGCRKLDGLYRVSIPDRAEIVVVSQGGAPKDLNLYQTQKALDNAKHAVRTGGTIILVGCCREGFGEPVFEQWLTQAESPEALIRRIRADFQLGGHKAAAIALVLQSADILLVSDLPEEAVRKSWMTPYGSAQSALDSALRKHGPQARVLVMPYGGSTLPGVAKAGAAEDGKEDFA